MRIFVYMKRLTEKEKQEMIELYTSGQVKIPRMLDEKYGVYLNSCYFILKRRNLIKYSNADQHRLFDQDYFENITTEKQAYFLGLLAADGNISKKTNTITLALNIDDGLELMEEFKKEIKSTGTISIHTDKRTDHKRKTMVKITFTSPKTKNDLQKMEIFPNKTTGLNYPNINKELDRHFIRGFIDGDGSFFYKRGILVFSLVGTESILKTIQNILIENTKINFTKLHKHKTGVFYLKIAHKDTLKIREWIYKDCSIAMKRKQNYPDRNTTLKSVK